MTLKISISVKEIRQLLKVHAAFFRSTGVCGCRCVVPVVPAANHCLFSGVFQLNQQNTASETVKNVNGFIENKSIYVTNYSKDFGGTNTVSESKALIGSNASAPSDSSGTASVRAIGNGHVVHQQSSTDETEIELKQEIPPIELPDVHATPLNSCDTTSRTHPPSVSDSAVHARDSAATPASSATSVSDTSRRTPPPQPPPSSARTSGVSDNARTPERRPSSPFVNGRTEVLIGQDAANEKIRTTAVVENHRVNLSALDSPSASR